MRLGQALRSEANMTTQRPDIFTNVHKGIRNALFQACMALGRAGDDAERNQRAREQLRQTLRFVEHHGDNEDTLLLPLIEERDPVLFARMHSAHGGLAAPLRALTSKVDTTTADELHLLVQDFIVLYLDHMREEERVFELRIRELFSAEELQAFGGKSVARTLPADQRMMLGFMLPVMTREDVDDFFSRVPAELAEQLRPLAA